jgi:hypothetical protein
MTVSAQNPVMMGQSAVNLSGLGQAFTARQMGHQTVALRGLGQVPTGMKLRVMAVPIAVMAGIMAITVDGWDTSLRPASKYGLVALSALSALGTFQTWQAVETISSIDY